VTSAPTPGRPGCPTTRPEPENKTSAATSNPHPRPCAI
jgi:hypothetical protein